MSRQHPRMRRLKSLLVTLVVCFTHLGLAPRAEATTFCGCCYEWNTTLQVTANQVCTPYCVEQAWSVLYQQWLPVQTGCCWGTSGMALCWTPTPVFADCKDWHHECPGSQSGHDCDSIDQIMARLFCTGWICLGLSLGNNIITCIPNPGCTPECPGGADTSVPVEAPDDCVTDHPDCCECDEE